MGPPMPSLLETLRSSSSCNLSPFAASCARQMSKPEEVAVYAATYDSPFHARPPGPAGVCESLVIATGWSSRGMKLALSSTTPLQSLSAPSQTSVLPGNAFGFVSSQSSPHESGSPAFVPSRGPLKPSRSLSWTASSDEHEPSLGSHVSIVQMSPSSQSTGFTSRHCPCLNVIARASPPPWPAPPSAPPPTAPPPSPTTSTQRTFRHRSSKPSQSASTTHSGTG